MKSDILDQHECCLECNYTPIYLLEKGKWYLETELDNHRIYYCPYCGEKL